MHCRLLARVGSALALCIATGTPAQTKPAGFADSMSERVKACTACHGPQGVATRDGYWPRIAGKPAGYLHHQLLHFRDGLRQHRAMNHLTANLSDAYLAEMAQHFADLSLPYPPSPAIAASAQQMARGRQLVTQGDVQLRLPACTHCHGATMTGVLPAVPGLLGLPRDYLVAQLGSWRTGQRRAHAPDCMAEVSKRLSDADASAVASFLAVQPVPADAKPMSAAAARATHGTRPGQGDRTSGVEQASLDLRCGAAEAMPPPIKVPLTKEPAGITAPPTPRTMQHADATVRGAYLARAGHCAGCHTPRGGPSYAGGRGIETPFGTVYAGNLTPDPATGLGRWTADDFWRALHQGQSKDGRWLSPAFPYTHTTLIPRADADDLWAYLRSLPAVQQAPTASTVRWPFNTQAAIGVWRWLYFRPGVFEGNPSWTTEVNRGAYLVNGPGHCAACHAPRNAWGASIEPLRLAGGLMPQSRWYAPSLVAVSEAGVQSSSSSSSSSSNGRRAVDRMASSPGELVTLLKTGINPHSGVSGPMADVVHGSTQHLDDADLRAMAAYLDILSQSESAAKTPSVKDADLPAIGSGSLPTTHPNSAFHLGRQLYEKHCADCHGAQGAGVAGAYPSLAGNRAVLLPNPINLVRVLEDGGYAPSTAGNPRPHGMPPYRHQLDAREIAAVLTYIRQAWGNSAAPVAELDVLKTR